MQVNCPICCAIVLDPGSPLEVNQMHEQVFLSDVLLKR